MANFEFPRIPYDEVESAFIREAIRNGDFSDSEHRRYVNRLVWIEWYTTDGLHENTTGVSGFGAAVHHWQIAAYHPEAYDIVRFELDAETRAEHRRTKARTTTDRTEERRQRARKHANEWQAVQESNQSP